MKSLPYTFNGRDTYLIHRMVKRRDLLIKERSNK
jgi:hypothetical protein